MSDSDGDGSTSHSLISNREIDEWVVVSTPQASDSEQNDDEPLTTCKHEREQTSFPDILIEENANVSFDVVNNAAVAGQSEMDSSLETSVSSSISNYSVLYNANDETAIIKSVKVDNKLRPGEASPERFLDQGVCDFVHLRLFEQDFQINWKHAILTACTCALVVFVFCTGCSLVQFKDFKVESQRQLSSCKSDLHNKLRQLAFCKSTKDFCESSEKPTCHVEVSEYKKPDLSTQERNAMFNEIRSMRENLSNSILAYKNAHSSRLLEFHWSKRINEFLSEKLRRLSDQFDQSLGNERRLGRLLADSNSRLLHLNSDLSAKEAELNRLKDEKSRLVAENLEKIMQNSTANADPERTKKSEDGARVAINIPLHGAFVGWTRRFFDQSESVEEELSDSSLDTEEKSSEQKGGENEPGPSPRCPKISPTWHRVAFDWTKDFFQRINEPAEQIIDFSTQLTTFVLNESTWQSLFDMYSKMKDTAGQSATDLLQNVEKSSKFAETVFDESVSGLNKLHDVLRNVSEAVDVLSVHLIDRLGPPAKRLNKFTQFSVKFFNESVVPSLQRVYDLLRTNSAMAGMDENFDKYENTETDETFTGVTTDDQNVGGLDSQYTEADHSVVKKQLNDDHENLDEVPEPSYYYNTDSSSNNRETFCTVSDAPESIARGAKILRAALKSHHVRQIFEEDNESQSEFAYYLAKLKILSTQRYSKREFSPQDTLWWHCQINWWADNVHTSLPYLNIDEGNIQFTMADCQVFMAEWQKGDDSDWSAKMRRRLLDGSPDLRRAIDTACLTVGREDKITIKDGKRRSVKSSGWFFDRWRERQSMRRTADVVDGGGDWMRRREMERDASRRATLNDLRVHHNAKPFGKAARRKAERRRGPDGVKRPPKYVDGRLFEDVDIFDELIL